MLLYNIDTRGSKRDENVNWNEKFRNASERVFRESGSNNYIAIHSCNEFKIEMVAAIKGDEDGNLTTIEELFENFTKYIGVDLVIKDIKEITEREFSWSVYRAYKDLLTFADSGSVEAWFGIDRGNCCYSDAVTAELNRNKIEQLAKETLYDKSFMPELERIYSMKRPEGCRFQPVYYIIRSDDPFDGKKMVGSLINALYESGRIRSKRYSKVNVESDTNSVDIRNAMALQAGGSIVLNMDEGDEGGGSYAYVDSYLFNVRRIANAINRCSENTLVIAVVPTRGEELCDILKEACLKPFVEITPENAMGEVARRYLTYKATSAGAEADEKLFSFVREDRAMTRWEMREQFAAWHANYLIEKEFPLYKGMEIKKSIKLEEAAGRAQLDLNDMIGLKKAKTIIGNAVDYYKVQKLYEAFGKQSKRASMHMVFTGNPGSAKTTVARLFAQILKDNGVIKNGELIEVGRADLVGKFVGSTAPKVKEAFEKAKGGVLFIDEAYSLVDDRTGLYGDEAINTIVQEMENNRDNTIVIFAGYPDKMETFLNRNPGLRSRIAFHVPFDDYSSDELMDIARLFARKGEDTFAEGCEEKLLEMFEGAIKEKDFGNGRFVRNVMEHAEMARASRLAKMEFSKIGERDLDTFLPEDFLSDSGKKDESKRKRIGF